MASAPEFANQSSIFVAIGSDRAVGLALASCRG
jgi:hypothetical protein